MSIFAMLRKIQSGTWIILFAMSGISGYSGAAQTDLANAPLASSSNTAVRPNLLFTLDDSGSMAWNFLPDYAGGQLVSGATANHCRISNSCGVGETPFMSNEYNGVAYNPRLTYMLPVNADGTLKASQGSPWTAVKVDGYGILSASTINLTNAYPEIVYSASSSCSGSSCKKNGVDTNNPFTYRASVSSDNPPLSAFPGTLTTSATVLSVLYNGVLNQATSTAGSTIFSGTLNVPVTSTLSITGPSLTRSSSTVTVSYTGRSPASPAPAVGDSLTVSGNNCSSSYRNIASNILSVGSNTFTYLGNSTNTNSWSNTACTVVVTHTSTPAAPSISSNNTTVTVVLSSAHGLSSGNTINIANGAGTCDTGYTGTTTVSVTNSTTFTYTAPANVVTAGNASCAITIPPVVTQPSSPGISLSGNTVTVKLTNHGLVTGDLVQVTNGSGGVCDSGYQTSSAISVTRISSSTFTYSPPTGAATANSNCTINKMTPGTTASYTTALTKNGAPYYFAIIPTEYCDSVYLTNCTASAVPVSIAGVAYNYPAPLRYCKNSTTAALPPGDPGAQLSVSGTTNCQAKYSVGTGINFQSVRYGLFYRIDVVPTTATYGNVVLNGTVNANGVNLNFSNLTVLDRSHRVDCAAAPNCTYAEEMTNFANWYAYYQTRIQMMKSAAGIAFQPLNDSYRVGFITINWSSGSSNLFLPVDVFNSTQKSSWYTKLYAISPGNSTPLREALARAGRYFAGKTDSLNSGMITNNSTVSGHAYHTDDPVQYSCQQNFTVMTTDGYWNGTDSNVKELDGTTIMRNYDNVNSGLSARSLGAYDGGVAGASNTLADVALYYYGTDLRPSGSYGALGTDVSTDNVPISATDPVAWQHMTTFTLGLADGLMTYQPDYATSTAGDFSRIKTASTGCFFSGSGTCNWPLPVHDSQTTLDDLWHAAVNGRGTYYNARDPSSLSRGLSGALAGINVHLAAAAASSTSSPNITQTNNLIFSSTYRTNVWDGDVIAQNIDPATGNVIVSYPAAGGGTQIYIWSAQVQLDSMVTADSTATVDSRNIYTFDGTNSYNGGGTNKLRQFLYTNLSATEQAYFDNMCSTFTLLSQCTAANLTATQITAGNSGANLINYLRGQKSYELTTPSAVYRPRQHTLGDTVNAKPAYIQAPQYNFSDAVTPSYASFASANANRQGVVYIAGNDGMLHAFNSTNGNEMWAYVPKIVMPSLYYLADANYASNHRFFVDGSPESMDIYVGAAAAAASGLSTGWHTILVAGLNSGGRGAYALDVTDPANPRALWEICSSSTLCNISDSDLGFVFGNPVITKRMPDGKWVVLITSGYNNTTPGSGQGILYVLDAVTGAILSKTSTNSGTAAAPSGLAKLSAWADFANTDNTTRFVYGGDLNGDIWRFDLGALNSSASPSATRFATLQDGLGNPQPITTRPELSDVLNNVDSPSATGNPALYIGTGRYLGTTDLSDQRTQSFYALKDNWALTGAAAYIGNPRLLPGNGPLAGIQQQSITQNTPTTRLITGNAVDWTQQYGWYVDFNPGGNSPGERVNLDPKLALGTLVVETNVPDANACTVGGYSWIYELDFKSGLNISTALNQVAGSKLGNAISVGFVIVSLPGGGGLTAISTDAAGNKTTTALPVSTPASAQPVSWRELVR
ncbi:MAG: PilC/PilY family type IV pilus protein [Pseudomonadota bacterium]